jgi:hypothetical protein
MELKFNELGLISLEHKDTYDDYLRRYPTEISEQTFTNLFMWRRSRPIKAVEVGDSLVTYEERDDGVIMFGQPIGPLPLGEAIEAVRAATGKDVALCDRVSENAVSPDVLKDYEVEEDRDYFDYTYSRGDLSDLEGRKYHKKRNLIKQCLSENMCEYEGISDKNLDEVSEMMDRWCKHKGCKQDRGLCHEYRATREVLTHFAELGLTGGAIRIGGRIEAFTVGEALNENTAVIHLEKAKPEFKGLYQVINQWFCQHALGAFEYVNREQDVGIPGLRQAKESYYPERLVKKFKVYPLGKTRSNLNEPAEFKRCLDEEG